MKTIWLLGGASWVSTVEYYRRINKKIHEQLGKNHSAKIILRSMDYEDIKQYNYKNWDKIEEKLMDEIFILSSCPVDCILICNNTLHKALDSILPHLNLEVPILHIVESVGEHMKVMNYKKPLLIGTKFTMEDGFYREGLEKYWFYTTLPEAPDREEIQRIIVEELSREVTSETSKKWLQDMIHRYDCDSVVVACTELPLIIKQEDFENIAIVDTLEVHVDRAVAFSLE